MTKKELLNASLLEDKKKRLMNILGAVCSGFNFRTMPGNTQLARDIRFMSKMYDKGGRWDKGTKHAMSSMFDKIFKSK